MSYCFNLFFLCYKAVVREQKILYFRSKLGLSYNIRHVLVGYVGKKCHLTSSLDSGGELSLVKSTSSGNSSFEFFEEKLGLHGKISNLYAAIDSLSERARSLGTENEITEKLTDLKNLI